MFWVQLKGPVEVDKGIAWIALFQQHNSELQGAQLDDLKMHPSDISTIGWQKDWGDYQLYGTSDMI